MGTLSEILTAHSWWVDSPFLIASMMLFLTQEIGGSEKFCLLYSFAWDHEVVL